MQSIYYEIYKDLRDRIIAGEYPYQSFIPSENRLVEQYQCSHNTLRKSLTVLRLHGFTQPIHGKGVKVIWQPARKANFALGAIETFKEAAARNHLTSRTAVRSFSSVVADEALAQRTGFESGTRLLRIERVRYLDGVAVVFDCNYLLEQLMPGLTPQIVEDSVYAYLEDELGMVISTSNRTVTVEYASPEDRDALDLLDFDMVAVVSGRTFNEKGVMFEYTISRHRPDYFTFHNTAIREC
ncbi:MAG: UTRA domain-containing protein [Atopobiaceae bacterium]|nr:UTRA domain-containing protein [Atopobiaceae bacterium]MBR3314536.1 UTRA domain-containing protein [Atopobiaceae bacterium]